jgi:hypothetical protein
VPPDQVLAADERITAWAGELKAAGLDGGMDELRARAYLDLLLDKDSRPRQDQGTRPDAAPAGFASRVTLTAPLATLTRLAGRPGELAGLGPVDPWLTRDLATAAAASPKTTWCLTVTDEKSHAVAHGEGGGHAINGAARKNQLATQMSLTRGRGHQLGFHRAVMASLIAKGQCDLPGSRPQPDHGQIGRGVSLPPTSTAG